MIPVENITIDYIQKHGIYTSNIIVHEKVPGEGHKVFLEKLEEKKLEEKEPLLKIGDNISFVHLYGVHPTTTAKDDVLPICLIDNGTIYITAHMFYQIDEKEGRRDLKLYIPI